MLTCEVCVDSVESIVSAIEANVNRIELCSSLNEGGLTPSIGLTKLAKQMISKTSIELYIMIRPRPSDFLYSELEFRIMKEDINSLKEYCDGFVFGILKKDATVDKVRVEELIKLSRPKGVTFHRAIDMCFDIETSLKDLMELKVDRILTSGGEKNVDEGLEMIKKLLKISNQKIIIMPGSGVNNQNIKKLVDIGITEYHLSGRKTQRISEMIFTNKKCGMGIEPLFLNANIVNEVIKNANERIEK
eukprot:gene9327-1414_t